MNAPVVIQKDGDLFISSEIIAERTGREHASVLRVIRESIEEFEEFGRVGFEIAPFVTAGGVQHREVAHLNEQQATLLMTFMRNSPVVKAFKLELVKQFYAMRQALMAPAVPQSLPEALRAYAVEVEQRQELEAKVKQDAPKVLFADSVAASRSTVLVGELAKILRANGVQVGQNRLFELLRQEGYLIKREGSDWNMPTQRSMELGLFEIKETAITHSDGHVSVNKTPKVTGRGQQYFINRYSQKVSS